MTVRRARLGFDGVKVSASAHCAVACGREELTSRGQQKASTNPFSYRAALGVHKL